MNQSDQRMAWEAMANIVAAHVIQLGQEGIIPERARDLIMQTIEPSCQGEPEGESLLELAFAFDRRLDSLCSPEVAGAASIGRGSLEVSAAVARMAVRSQLLEIAGATANVRETLISAARPHATTLMAGEINGFPAEPTTFAHVIGGVVGPLDRASANLVHSFESVNRSPFGAGTMSSSPFAVDRQVIADALGFTEVIDNTFDAVSGVDYFGLAALAIEQVIEPLLSFLQMLDQWQKPAVDAIRFQQARDSSVHDLRHYQGRGAVAKLVDTGQAALLEVTAIRTWLRSVAFGPVLNLDEPLNRFSNATEFAMSLLNGVGGLFENGVEINRAYLARTANEPHLTSGDISAYLMSEAHIAPGDADLIAARVLAAAREQGIGLSGLTNELIDTAAFMVVGRELGLEYESVTRYLSPRRYIERRTSDGAPAPEATRAWLQREEQLLENDRATLQSLSAKLSSRESTLQASIHGAASEEP